MSISLGSCSTVFQVEMYAVLMCDQEQPKRANTDRKEKSYADTVEWTC